MGKNTILGFDWEKDIDPYSANNRPSEFYEPINQEEIRIGNFITRSVPLVQKDPLDSLVLRGSNKVDSLDIWALKNTIDKYLISYYDLFIERGFLPENVKLLKQPIPLPIAERYHKYRKQTSNRKKKLVSSLDLIKYINEFADTELPYEMFQLDSTMAPLYLHHFCRDMTTRKNASNKKASLEYDGLKFSLEGYDDFIPSFLLAHYIKHEWETKISLSIEITSILFEMKDFCKMLGYPDDLWKKAYTDFKLKALPTILQSDCIFARITAARHFFQHIMLEASMYFYQGARGYNTFWETKKDWDKLVDHACIYCGALKAKVEYTRPQDIENAFVEVEELLNSIVEPVDFDSIVSNPGKRLAIFCNPKHKYVSLFIDILEKRSINGIELGEEKNKIKKGKNRSSDVQFNRHRSKEELVFQNVHRDVKELADQLYEPNNYIMDIPREWKPHERSTRDGFNLA